jgi:hypothetical protein
MQSPILPVLLPHNDPTKWETIKQLLNHETKNSEEFIPLLNKLIQVSSGTSGHIFPYFQEIDLGDDFYSKILPFIKNLVLQLPSLFPDPLPHLTKNTPNESVSLSRTQVAALM